MGYCIWKINRLIFLQHFVFQKLFHGWVYCDYPDHDEATAVPNSKDATLTILVSEAGRTAYHEETWLPSLTILCRVNWKRFTKQTRREIKKNWTCLRNQKCWSLLIRSKNCFQRLNCHARGGAISLKQTMSGAVLTLQWNCDSGHFGTWASSDVLTVRNNQKVYVNNFQMAAAITQWK